MAHAQHALEGEHLGETALETTSKYIMLDVMLCIKVHKFSTCLQDGAAGHTALQVIHL